MTQPNGVLEIYDYYQPIADIINERKGSMDLSLGIGFLILYVMLISIVWRGWRVSILQRKEQIQAEKLFMTLFDSSPVGVFTIIQGKFKLVNSQFEKINGYSKDELEGMDAINLVVPQDRKLVHDNAVKMLKGQINSPYEFRITTKSGDTKWVMETVVSINIQGQRATLGNQMDITEKKEAMAILNQQKELIERIIESTPNAVLVVDRNGNIVLNNRTFCDYFALKTQNLVGEQLREIIPAKSVLKAVATVLERKQSHSKIEFSHQINEHNNILNIDIISMSDDQVLIILNDITEDRERQERLYLTDRLASVGEMASGIAHELNNPPTGVIGMSQLLVNEEGLPEELKEDIQAIYSEARRAANIVRNLLTFARKHAAAKTPTQVNNVVEDVLKLRAYEHKVKNIHINTDLDPDLPEITADYFQIQQVFLNIILNAESAMIEAHNGGSLTTTTKRENGHVKVSFTDDGPGITRENIDRMFDPFYTTKEVGKGTGLGLSICYGIVSNHGGRIYAKSKIGKGATFILELPINNQ
jgi:PAS domain S-box-containing protein